jgi:hypothetical protein
VYKIVGVVSPEEVEAVVVNQKRRMRKIIN